MDKMTMLWIRACKSGNPVKRCNSILRRFYIVRGDPDSKLVAIINHLSPIVEEYKKVSIVDVMSYLDPDKLSFLKDDRSYREKCRDYLITEIAFSKSSKFKKCIFKKRLQIIT